MEQQMTNPFAVIDQKLDHLKMEMAQIKKAMKPHEDDLLDLDGACQFLGKAKQTVYGLVSRNSVPHFKRGNKLYFSKKALRNWIESGRVATNSEIQNSI